jgi:hypothetical protein
LYGFLYILHAFITSSLTREMQDTNVTTAKVVPLLYSPHCNKSLSFYFDRFSSACYGTGCSRKLEDIIRRISVQHFSVTTSKTLFTSLTKPLVHVVQREKKKMSACSLLQQTGRFIRYFVEHRLNLSSNPIQKQSLANILSTPNHFSSSPSSGQSVSWS